MHRRDTFEVLTAAIGLLGDAAALFAGFMLAVWIRFFSGYIRAPAEYALPPMSLYLYGAFIGTLLFLLIYAVLGLYERPQVGGFSDKIPRLTRATLWGIFVAMVLAFAIATDPPFSRLVVGLSFFTVLGLVVAERYLLFKIEIVLARRQKRANRVLVLGTDENAGNLKEAIEQEPRLRSEIVGFLKTGDAEPHTDVPLERILGDLNALPDLLTREGVDHVILSNLGLPHERMVEIIMHCERAMAKFHLVPDLFRILTTNVRISTIGGIPLLGIGKWPLDYVWNRAMKRAEDITGGVIGLILSAPVIAAAAAAIKITSPGPVFYRQERCGESGNRFIIHKLRTMTVDAEETSGPVWADRDDPRRTPVGAFLRRYNLDELPQFWNVLKGDMSLVGPRPERPHFVEQFKEVFSRYMSRHFSKPGMTGWAQVNGLRGNTSLEERIKHDLYYLENWSLAFDFKILMKTFFARDNAY